MTQADAAFLEWELLWATEDYLAAKAKAEGVDLNVLVNDLLKKDIDLIEGVK